VDHWPDYARRWWCLSPLEGMSDVVGLQLPNSRTNVLIAASIAHYNGGYFRQNDPIDWITIESESSLRVERNMIYHALGRPCSDELWQLLLIRPLGQVVTHESDVIVIQ